MSDSKQQYFQFTLGPVQGFVAQARRTRDFWAGSFILSWLSSVAIEAVITQGGEIMFPMPDNNYLNFLRTGEGEHKNIPLQGSIPNRFKAITATVPKDFNAKDVADAVRGAWEKLTNIIWKNDLNGHISKETQIIWDRQVKNFWEISWVLFSGEKNNLLDRRKNWRSQVLEPEPGLKCVMMDGWQELSGYSEKNLTKVNAFWNSLRESNLNLKIDLKEGEHLCALAFIKRRFSRYFKDVEYTIPNTQKKVLGWKLPNQVPSVSFIAAAPWLAHTIKNNYSEFESFYHKAKKISSEYIEMSNEDFNIDIQCVHNVIKKLSIPRNVVSLSADIYFENQLENKNIFDDQQNAHSIKNQLLNLYKSTGSKPSPYYAVLLMDGDQLGKQMSEPKKQPIISDALNTFTSKAGEVVRNNNGFLIYAGGDDVLALLPLDNALDAANQLQIMYKNCFIEASNSANKDINKKDHTIVESTLSGAIEYIHINSPFTIGLRDSHDLLDNIAKDKTGRDAIAIRVWKPSGLALQWAMPWQKATDNKTIYIQELAQLFRKQGNNHSPISNKFLFRAKEVMDQLTFHNDDEFESDLEKILEAEFVHSFDGKPKENINFFKDLLAQCKVWKRTNGDCKQDINNLYNSDAMLLVRFLAQYAFNLKGDNSNEN